MQNIIALLIVATAAGFLGWRGWKIVAARKSGGGCGSCGACPNNGEAGLKITPLVTIDLPKAGKTGAPN
jgi:hypothetical protein